MSYGFLQRWRSSTRSPIVVPEPRPARTIFRFADIGRGWSVEDSDAARIGRVVSSRETVIVVSRGIFASRVFVPPSAVAEVHEGVVRLNVTVGWVEAQGWDREHGRRGH